MEYVYIFGLGTLFGAIVSIVGYKSGAKTYARAISPFILPEEYPENTDGEGTDPESWDWDQYDNYIKGNEDETN